MFIAAVVLTLAFLVGLALGMGVLAYLGREVIRDSSRIETDRIRLWAHLASEHALVLDLDETWDELHDIHGHEHRGPGTIRNHDETSRYYSLKKMGETLAEAEDC